MKSSYDKVALVTGANRGLGFETCRQLARKGIFTFIGSRNQEKGLQAATHLGREKLPVQAIQLDVTDETHIRRASDYISKEVGRLDILVNNAGIFLDQSDAPEGASILKTPIETILKTLETNTFGSIRMIQAFIPLLKKKPSARIVNISSGMGQLSEMKGNWPAYRISKTALNAVTRILADELQNTSILVNSVCPGWVRTDMGGLDAERTPQEAVDTIIWLATLPEGGPTGDFFRDRKSIPW